MITGGGSIATQLGVDPDVIASTAPGIISFLPGVMSVVITMASTPLSPLVLSGLAGASTCLGAAVVFALPSLNSSDPTSAPEDAVLLEKCLSFSLSLAASVMITVSAISILPECLEGVIVFSHIQNYPTLTILDSNLLTERILGFSTGCLAYFLLSLGLSALPEPGAMMLSSDWSCSIQDDSTRSVLLESPSDASSSMPALSLAETERRSKAWRVALLIFFSLLLHNAPEGLAVAVSSIESPELGVVVALGIAAHNIPEGLAIAVPCLAARPDAPWLAFLLASASGLAEPLGAWVALQWLEGEGSTTATLPLDNILAAVAGIMIMVSIRDLYPEALRHTTTTATKGATNSMGGVPVVDSTIALGTLSGMVLMTVTESYLPH